MNKSERPFFPLDKGMVMLMCNEGPNAILCTSVFIRRGTFTSRRTYVTSSCNPDLSLVTLGSGVC